MFSLPSSVAPQFLRLSRIFPHRRDHHHHHHGIVNRFSSNSAQLLNPNETNQKYRFTLDHRGNHILSTEQRDHYEQSGYLVIKQMVEQNELEKYHRRFNEYAEGQRKPHSRELILLREVTSLKSNDSSVDASSLYKINELYEDEVLFEYCKLPRILDHVQCITGPNIMMVNSMLINKPPDKGTKSSRHPLHQDLYYFPFRPADRIVCAWTAMERITRGNGCLVVVPGSHKFDLLEHENPDWKGGVNLFYDGIKDKSLIKDRVHLLMEPGDCVLFHSNLIHGSGMNRTKGYRKAISAHYAPVEAQFIDIRGTQTEKIGKQFMETLKKRYKSEVMFDYATMWKVRGRLMRGEGGWNI